MKCENFLRLNRSKILFPDVSLQASECPFEVSLGYGEGNLVVVVMMGDWGLRWERKGKRTGKGV